MKIDNIKKTLVSVLGVTALIVIAKEIKNKSRKEYKKSDLMLVKNTLASGEVSYEVYNHNTSSAQSERGQNGKILKDATFIKTKEEYDNIINSDKLSLTKTLYYVDEENYETSANISFISNVIERFDVFLSVIDGVIKQDEKRYVYPSDNDFTYDKLVGTREKAELINFNSLRFREKQENVKEVIHKMTIKVL